MVIKFFEVGAHNGAIIDEIIKLAKSIGCDYQVIAFEPGAEANAILHGKYKKDPKVEIYKLALTDKTVDGVKLYHSNNTDGYSLCNTKWNVKTDKFENVSTEKFSVFLATQPKKQTGEFWLLDVDIEGSEYEFYPDLVDSGAYKEFDMIIGSLKDLRKIGKPEQEAEAFERWLKKFVTVVVVEPNNLENLEVVGRAIVEQTATEGAVEESLTANPVPEQEPIQDVDRGQDFKDEDYPEIETIVAKAPAKSTKPKRTINKKIKEVKR